MHQVIYGVIRRRQLMRTGLIGDWYGSDRQLLVELALLGGFARVEDVLFHHREHEGRSHYVPDKAKWMTAVDATQQELGYWRRLGHMRDILSREYLEPRQRLAIVGEYFRYGAVRAPHWIPQLGRELTAAVAEKAGMRRRTANRTS